MRDKKVCVKRGCIWVLIVLALSLALVTVWNLLTDPFGVFGDPLFQWYSYNETNNPGAAKTAYLHRQGQKYDSYVIGSMAAASYDPEELNDYLGGSFYNYSIYGSDLRDHWRYARYAVEELGAKRIILNLDLNETNRRQKARSTMGDRNSPLVTDAPPVWGLLSFALANPKYGLEKIAAYRQNSFLPQPFDGFLEETGCYDHRVGDVERIGDPAVYEALRHGGCEETEGFEMRFWKECVDSVSAIKELCDQNGVQLLVICSPVPEDQWQSAPQETLRAYKKALAQVTDYWDFSHSSLSFDSRFFYRCGSFRKDAGSMMLARMFGREDVYLPGDFGLYVTEDQVDGCVDRLLSVQPAMETVCVPTLMYHDIAPEGDGNGTISLPTFERQLALIDELGYNTVTLEQLVDYVHRGIPLPENPICLTFDDGYRSNYEYAWPLLQKYGMKGTIFAIGCSIGKDTYKDTEYPMRPHFTWDEAREMQDSGVMDVQSHTYDMHQWPPFEERPPEQCRRAMIPLAGEEEKAFIAAVEQDLRLAAEDFSSNSHTPLIGLAYPTGAFSTLTEVLVHGSGIPVTFSTLTDQRNILVPGLHQSLYGLCRLNVTDQVTDQQLIAYLNDR